MGKREADTRGVKEYGKGPFYERVSSFLKDLLY
jgi:hypothetical protein